MELKGLTQVFIRKTINRFKRLAIDFYRYPFKLVVRPRRALSNLNHKRNRLSPPGFNSEKDSNYDLYLEPDSLSKLAHLFSILITLSLIIASLYKYNTCITDRIWEIIFPSILFLSLYYGILKLTNLNYYSYPIFYNNWSRNLDCYSGWFRKVPQEIHLNKKDINNSQYKTWLGNKPKLIVKRERQPLYYSWNTGSSQKGMWLLAIENLISSWELGGIFKKHTSIFVIFCPIWAAYISLLIILFLYDIENIDLVKTMYIPAIIWLLCSIFYLLMISFFTVERRKNEIRTNNSIVRFIPYELRSSAPRYNNLYNKFKTKHFLFVSNALFVVLLTFFISLISLIQ